MPQLSWGAADKAVAGNLLFDMLSKEARRAIFASMEPLMVSAGTPIITQVSYIARQRGAARWAAHAGCVWEQAV